MGTLGTGLNLNDTYADIYDQFIELYNEDFSVPDITSRLIKENTELINMPDESSNFWFALANAQWECKALDPNILSKVKGIIKNGDDLEAWKSLGATQQDLRSREKITAKFLEKIQIEKSQAKKRVKKQYHDSLFNKGDCLVYKMDNGNYGGSFVLTDEKNTEFGANYIAITTINTISKPILDDFRNADIYTQRTNERTYTEKQIHEQLIDRPFIVQVLAVGIKNNFIDIEVIGNLKISQEYKPIKLTLRMISWRALKIIIPSKDEYEKTNGVPNKIVKLNTYLKKGLFDRLFQ